MALTYCTLTLSLGVKQNIGQWDRMFLDNFSCEKGSSCSPPPPPLALLLLLLLQKQVCMEMWEVCLSELAAGPLKNAPSLAKRPAFL